MRVQVAKSEASAEPVELEYGGQVYTLPPNLPLAALEAMEQNLIVAFLRACLGSQWEAFSADFSTADIEALADALAELYGRTLGELGASGGS